MLGLALFGLIALVLVISTVVIIRSIMGRSSVSQALFPALSSKKICHYAAMWAPTMNWA